MRLWGYHDPIPDHVYQVMIWVALIVGFLKGCWEDRRNRRG